jgi:hypothetical protein
VPLPEELPVASAERARALQDHLVRTAYALHFTAADLAAQHERRVEPAAPTSDDHRAKAAVWLALSGHALEIVHRWDPRVAASDVQRASSALDMANGVIERVFRSTLKLHAVMPLVGEVAREHLQEAVQELDLAVGDIRRFALDEVPRVADPSTHP